MGRSEDRKIGKARRAYICIAKIPHEKSNPEGMIFAYQEGEGRKMGSPIEHGSH